MNNRAYQLLLALLLSVGLTACDGSAGVLDGESDFFDPETAVGKAPADKAEKKEEKSVPVAKEVDLTAVGDVLIHARVYNDARIENGYDFMPMIERVVPYLNDTTITMANQETMIGGEDVSLSDYPAFNSPPEVGDALKEAGVDIVTIANNHTLDRGEAAIQSALRHWDSLGVLYAGAYKNEKDSDEIRIIHTEEGIDLAFLSYTFSTNGIPTPDGKSYLVNRIDEEKIARDINQAKGTSDAIVLSLHFGTEYEELPNQRQKELVQFAADKGVDIVIGHHPHVLQPFDWVEGKGGNETFVAYSLGNFLSGQDEFYNQIGGILKLTIEKTVDEKIVVKEPKFLPTFVDFENETNYRVIPMYQLTEQDVEDAKAHYEKTKGHVSQWMPEIKFMED